MRSAALRGVTSGRLVSLTPWLVQRSVRLGRVGIREHRTMSGELLLALAYGASMIVVGAIAYRIVKRDCTPKSRLDDET